MVRPKPEKETVSQIILAPLLLALVFLVFPIAGVRAADLIINEIMYNLPGADEKHEWIELYNAGSTEIDLTGWKFNDGDNATNHGLNPPPKNGSRGSIIIPPRSYTLLADQASTTGAELTDFSGTIIDTVMNLSNAGAALKILNLEGIEIALADYTQAGGADGNGKTLEWDGTNFRESAVMGGTPGATNSVFVLNPSPFPSPSTLASPSPAAQPPIPPVASPSIAPPPTMLSPAPSPSPTAPAYQRSENILINEFLPYPAKEEKEWVELYNNGDETINVTGWQIDDSENSIRPQLIESNAEIKPKSFLVVYFNRATFNNDGDEIRLLWPDGQLLHAVSYQNAPQGLSCSRLDDNQWLWTNQPTPGQTNKKSTPASSSSPAPPPASAPIISPTFASPSFSAAPPLSQPPAPSSLIETIQPKSAVVSSEPAKPALVSPRQESAAALADSRQKSNAPSPSVAAFPAQPEFLSADKKIPNLAAAGQNISSRSTTKTILYLLALIILSALAALGLIYFRRRTSTINSKKSKD